jgi:anti-sigma B factor antagonist
MTRHLTLTECVRYAVTEILDSAPGITELKALSKRAEKHGVVYTQHGGELATNWYRMAGHVVVEVFGSVDVYTAPRLREVFIHLVDIGEYNFIVDLEGVNFLDSTGLGVFVGGLKRARAHDGQMRMVCTQERIIKIFRISSRLDRLFGFYKTIMEAAIANQ